MTKLTLKDRLTRYLRNHGGWIASGELQRIVSQATTYTPQTTGRELRLLHEAGVLEVDYREKNHAWYRFNNAPKEATVGDMVKWFDSLPDKPEGWVGTTNTTSVGQSPNKFPNRLG